MRIPTDDEITTSLIRCASEAGSLLMKVFGDNHSFRRKGSLRDITSSVDLAAEEVILSVLSETLPGIPVIAEEKHRDSIGTSRTFISVDGLDGSVNFVHGLPDWAVSIGWIEDGRPTNGVIFSPANKEIFYGSLALGAFRNQERVRVTSNRLANSLLAASFSGNITESVLRSAEYSIFGNLNDCSQGVLRSGSGALNLARMSAGRIDGVWGRNARIWDVFPGIALVRAAGGEVWVSDIDWENFTVEYIAGGIGNFDELRDKAYPDYSAGDS